MKDVIKRLQERYHYALVVFKELVKTNFKLRYQGSYLGVLWSVLQPLMLFTVMYVVFVKFLKFTDGTPFTADAVKKNIDAVMANRTRHAWLDMINEIESSEVVDEHTWRLHLRHPYFPALIELGLSRPFRFISPACMKDGGRRTA